MRHTLSLIYLSKQDVFLRFSPSSGNLKETIYNHVDYVQSLSVLANQWVATGGRADHAIFVYETDAAGKLWKRHRFDGHEVGALRKSMHVAKFNPNM